MKTLQDLFEDSIKDLYSAEKQFLAGMQKLSKAAQNPELKKAIEDHIVQTEGQIGRIDQIAELGDFRPGGKACKAAQGLVEEAKEHLEEYEPGPTLDAAIIACAQKNEHYEICSYGTAVAWAKLLGNDEITALLQQTLEEEESADQALSGVAEAVNQSALQPEPATAK